jgi:hypothetical protein
MRRTVLPVILAATLVGSMGLAGCLESGTTPDADPQAGGDADARADGLALQLSRDRPSISPGETVHVNASVTNEGQDAVGYREGCFHEWNVAVLHDGDEVNWSRPMATCDGFSWQNLEPGETLPYPHVSGQKPFRWNGTLWDGEDRRWADAPAGDYQVRIGFEYTPDGAHESGQLTTIAGSATVTVDG